MIGRRGVGAARAAVRERGQASVELLGALPALVVLGLALLQLLAVGFAAALAAHAAHAGALALAGGADAQGSARNALPGWSRARARVEVRDGRVTVRLRPPSPLAAVARRLQVSSSAAVARP